MRTKILALVCFGLGICIGLLVWPTNGSSADAATTPIEVATSPPPATTPPVVKYGPDKPLHCSYRTFRYRVNKIYRKDKVTKADIERLYQSRKCLKHPAKALRFQRLAGEQRRYRLELKKLTPFIGPNGTRWAVPYAVVYCESKGRWSADNPTSDARGPYQLLGHGEPWPANTPARKLAHHRIAGNLYRSSGLGPWVSSKGCWG